MKKKKLEVGSGLFLEVDAQIRDHFSPKWIRGSGSTSKWSKPETLLNQTIFLNFLYQDDWISYVKIPILQLHAQDDETISVQLARKLYSATKVTISLHLKHKLYTTAKVINELAV